jgi:hypothetical protein
LVYLQRARATPGRCVRLPRPHGTAPLALASDAGDGVVAAVAAGESVWLGFQAVDRAVPTTLRIRAGTQAWELTCPPDTRLEGRLFGAGEELAVERVSVRLLLPEAFTALTGRDVPPTDPDAAYKGWRLP